MSLTHDEPSERSRPWQSRPWIQVLAAVLGVLPVYSTLIALQLASDEPISIGGLTLYLAVIAPLGIVIALLLLRFLCRENPQDLNLIPGKLSLDLLATLVLSIVVIVANIVSTMVLSALIPESSSDTSVTDLFGELAANLRLLVLFAGPLFLVGAASEEVIRAFLLSRLWKVWPGTTAKLLAVVLSACLFGLIHLYQGPVSAAWTAIFGLITALYYLRYGRVVPLILAHYVTNAFQVVVFALLAR